MKVELDTDEAWELMSLVVARLLDEASLADRDRAKVRRWRSEAMRPGDEPMRLLASKINKDLSEVFERKRRSQLRKRSRR